MNDWNPVEHPFRSWKPRTPSARLKARLFPASDANLFDSPRVVGGRWAWLAPVMGCFLAVMVVSGARSNQFGDFNGRRDTDWLSAVANNQSYAAYVVVGFHSEQNALQQDPIEWTNGPRASRAVGSVLLAQTNSLLH